MNPLKKTYRINAPIDTVWQALTTIRGINGWGGGPAKMDLKPGGEFSLWGKDIFGKNIEINAPKKLAQDWQYQNWENPSKVVFELKQKGNTTTLVLTHSDVPAQSVKSIDQGWDDYYLGPLKEYVEHDQ